LLILPFLGGKTFENPPGYFDEKWVILGSKMGQKWAKNGSFWVILRIPILRGGE